MKQKGFTLIECMIVLAIIAILTAVLSPYLHITEYGTVNWKSPAPRAPYVPKGKGAKQQCIGGLTYVITNNQATLIRDDTGQGVKC